jgi:hypothetical protein
MELIEKENVKIQEIKVVTKQQARDGVSQN